MRHRRPALVAALALSVAAAACNGADTPTDPSAPGTRAPTSAAATTSTVSPASSPLLTTMAPLKLDPTKHWPTGARGVFEAYVRAEQAAIRARMNPPNSNDPGLLATHTDSALDRRRASIRETAAKGQAMGAPRTLEISPVTITNGDEFTVLFTTCYRSDESIYIPATGQVIATAEFEVPLAIAMERIADNWHLRVRTERDEWKGKTCAEAFS